MRKRDDKGGEWGPSGSVIPALGTTQDALDPHR